MQGLLFGRMYIQLTVQLIEFILMNFGGSHRNIKDICFSFTKK